MRKGGPRVEQYRRGGTYQVTGLPEVSPIFPNRPEAEKWLRRKLETADRINRPMVRRCLRCGNDFQSAHAGNRLCKSCRAALA